MKKLLVFLVSVLTMALLAAGCGGDADKKDAAAGEQQVLNLFSWADNFDPEVIAEFEKQYNCKVNYDVFANNEELLAKIQAGGAQYDLIQPSDYMVATMLKLDLLEKMNMDNIPNAKNLVSTLQAPVYDPTGDHSLVYTWGITGIAYNKNYVKDVPDSWEDLWNPEYAGRLILLNDSRETIGMALKKNGFSNNSTDPNSTDPAQVEKAFQDLKALAPNVLAFDTDTIKQKFIAEEAWIGTMWTGDASYTLKDNPNIGFVVPKEGATIWADTFAIPKGAPKAQNIKNWPKNSSTLSMTRKSALKTMNTSATTTRTKKPRNSTAKNSKTIQC